MAQGLFGPSPPWRHGTAQHKTVRHAEIPTPPPHGRLARHGTAENGAAVADSDTPPPLCQLHLGENHYFVVTSSWLIGNTHDCAKHTT